MTVVAAIATGKFALLASDSRIFISGLGADSFVDSDRLNPTIVRIKCNDGTTGLLGFAGYTKFRATLIKLLATYASPSKVPPDEWPDEEGDECYSSLYLHESGLWNIMGKSAIVNYPLPCYATTGTGGDAAAGSIETQTWRRKNLSNLSEAEVRLVLKRALQVACKIDIACGGHISIRRY